MENLFIIMLTNEHWTTIKAMEQWITVTKKRNKFIRLIFGQVNFMIYKWSCN